MNTRAQEFVIRLLLRKWRKRYAKHQVPKFKADNDQWLVIVHSASAGNPFREKKLKRRYHNIPDSGAWELPETMTLLRNMGFKVETFTQQGNFKYYLEYDGMLCGIIHDMR